MYTIIAEDAKPDIEYCPECGWNIEHEYFPGNNGLVEKAVCTYCGWKEL